MHLLKINNDSNFEKNLILNKMKKLKLLLIMITALTVTACSNDDNDVHDYHIEYVNVVDAEVPDEFVFGHTYKIKATIELPNGCYYYYDQLNYVYEGASRLIYPIAHVDDGVNCIQNIREVTFTIPVTVRQDEPYLFKFYQGEDEDGASKFLTIEVPVI